MIRCDDGSLYTGVTTDLERRFAEHQNGKRGARYFAGRQPDAVVWVETDHDRSTALQREAAIKKLSRKDKLAMVAAAGSD